MVAMAWLTGMVVWFVQRGGMIGGVFRWRLFRGGMQFMGGLYRRVLPVGFSARVFVVVWCGRGLTAMVWGFFDASCCAGYCGYFLTWQFNLLFSSILCS